MGRGHRRGVATAFWQLAKEAPLWRRVVMTMVAAILVAGWIGIAIDGVRAMIDGVTGARSITIGWFLDCTQVVVALFPVYYFSELIGLITVLLFWRTAHDTGGASEPEA